MGMKIEDLTVTFKNHVTAIDHANLEIPKGIFGLLGENGAGKTTLMRVLTTVLSPAGGTVTIDGIRYNEENYEKIRKKIGYLPQEIDLYPSLTVQECLEYMGALSGISKQACKERIDCYLAKTSLSEHRRKKIKQLSGGMKRRVGLIQALLNEPEFLIVDEPTTGILLVVFSEDRNVFFSTHVVEDLTATCDRLAVMKKGKFLYAGNMKELLAQAEGHVWVCKAADETMARKLEREYHVSSKQYMGGELRIKLISERPPQIECLPCETTLEDAYIYITNSEPQASVTDL